MLCLGLPVEPDLPRQEDDLLWPRDTPGMVKRFVKEAACCARASHGSADESSEEEAQEISGTHMQVTCGAAGLSNGARH